MASGSKDKNVRSDRRSQPSKSDSDATDTALARNSSSNSVSFTSGFNESMQNPDINPNSDDNDWGYCTEDQLQELLLKKLEALYNEAISKLVALGYDKELVLRAVLRNGHCYGNMDALTNVMHNTLGYLNSKASESNQEDTKQVFADLTQLREFSLACLVCLLRRVKPSLSRGDAMWCLLMSELHVGHASTMEIPVAPTSTGNGDGNNKGESSSSTVDTTEKVKGDSIGVTPASCRFHGGWGFRKRRTTTIPVKCTLVRGDSDVNLERDTTIPVKCTVSRADSDVTLERDTTIPVKCTVSRAESGVPLERDTNHLNWSDLSPAMNMLMKRNVAIFAEEYRANLKKRPADGSSSEDNPSDCAGESLKALSVRNQQGTEIMLKKFRDLNLEGDTEIVAEDQKDEMVISLFHEIKDLERQVKERKEWAHQKAMQAARKLSHDLTELKMLRMEREENQRIKQGKPTAEDPTMKRLSEMETALRKASGQVDRANSAVRQLEEENAEIRAEMEASKLSASESVAMCLEAARREKKYLKKLLTWEKQRAKLQEDIATEKQKLIELQEEMRQVEAAKKKAEEKWKKEQKAKERALLQVEEERRLKESTEAKNKRNQETLRSKIELDFQRYKDDLQRLEHEHSRMKISSDPNHQMTNASPYPEDETIARMLNELDDLDEKEEGIDRDCVICLKDEVSVVFLPCAHQVVCAGCNEEFGRTGKAKCPTCRVTIEQRISVFGASS